MLFLLLFITIAISQAYSKFGQVQIKFHGCIKNSSKIVNKKVDVIVKNYADLKKCIQKCHSLKYELFLVVNHTCSCQKGIISQLTKSCSSKLHKLFSIANPKRNIRKHSTRYHLHTFKLHRFLHVYFNKRLHHHYFNKRSRRNTKTKSLGHKHYYSRYNRHHKVYNRVYYNKRLHYHYFNNRSRRNTKTKSLRHKHYYTRNNRHHKFYSRGYFNRRNRRYVIARILRHKHYHTRYNRHYKVHNKHHFGKNQVRIRFQGCFTHGSKILSKKVGITVKNYTDLRKCIQKCHSLKYMLFIVVNHKCSCQHRMISQLTKSCNSKLAKLFSITNPKRNIRKHSTRYHLHTFKLHRFLYVYFNKRLHHHYFNNRSRRTRRYIRTTSYYHNHYYTGYRSHYYTGYRSQYYNHETSKSSYHYKKHYNFFSYYINRIVFFSCLGLIVLICFCLCYRKHKKNKKSKNSFLNQDKPTNKDFPINTVPVKNTNSDSEISVSLDGYKKTLIVN